VLEGELCGHRNLSVWVVGVNVELLGDGLPAAITDEVIDIIFGENLVLEELVDQRAGRYAEIFDPQFGCSSETTGLMVSQPALGEIGERAVFF